MAGRWTWRRVAGLAAVLLLVGATGTGVALRAAQRSAEEKKGSDAPVTLEFGAADLVRVDANIDAVAGSARAIAMRSAATGASDPIICSVHMRSERTVANSRWCWRQNAANAAHTLARQFSVLIALEGGSQLLLRPPLRPPPPRPPPRPRPPGCCCCG